MTTKNRNRAVAAVAAFLGALAVLFVPVAGCGPRPANVGADAGAKRTLGASSPAFARLQVSVNGAAPTTGLVTVVPPATVQLSPASVIGVTQWQWEIYDYPAGFPLPSGWFWEGIAGQSPMAYTGGYFPPSFSIPAQGSQTWGPFMLRLRVNGNPLQYTPAGAVNQGFVAQLTDESTILKFPSPAGLEGIGFNESTQGDPLRSYIGALMRTFRVIDADLTAAGGAQIYGGGYTSAVASVALPTAQTPGICTFNTSYPTNRNVTTSNGVAPTVAGIVLVSGSLSLNTSSVATQVVAQIYRNGAPMTDTARSVNTATGSTFVDLSMTTLVQAAANDTFMLEVQATSSSVTLNYFGSLLVMSVGGTQGLQGPQGPSGGQVAAGGTPLTGGSNLLAVGSQGYAVDATAGAVTAQLQNGATDREAKTFTIIGGTSAFTLTTVGGSGLANLHAVASGGVSGNAVTVTGVATKLTVTWVAAANAGAGGWY